MAIKIIDRMLKFKKKYHRERKRKIRIMHLIEDLGRGGAEKRLLNDLKYLNKDKFVNFVFYLFYNNSLEREIRHFCVQTKGLNLRGGISDIKTILKLYRFVKEEEIDIIHTQLFKADLLGRMLSLLTRRPIITTFQSAIYEKSVDFLYSPKRHFIDKITTNLLNNRVITVSEFVKLSLINNLKLRDSKIEVIYNSVEDELLEVDPKLVVDYKREFKGESGHTLLLTVGKLNPGKGHKYLIEAIARPDLRQRNIMLLIAGNGNLKDELEIYSKSLGVHTNVLFLGDVEHIKEIIAICDIFVFPTLSEGLPLSLLEAMVQAKPVIASDIGPISEIVEDGINGLLVPPRDSKALALAIVNLLDDRERSKDLGRKARNVVLDKFNAKLSADKLGRLYETLITRPR